MTTLTLLPHDSDDALTAFVEPGAYIRFTDPDGFVVRLPEDATAPKVLELGRKLSHQEKKAFHPEVTIRSGRIDAESVTALAAGLKLGTYSAGQSKQDFSPHPLAKGNITAEVDLEDALIQIDTRMRIMRLVDAPANQKRPQDLAAWAKESGRRFGYDVRVLDKAACEKESMQALLAVNRGSEDPCVLILCEYHGADDDAPLTAMIGKGVTFDTGGISIKGSQNLHLMKSDMGGAAAVLGTVEAAARLRLPVNIVGLVPATDNSVDALSIKPSDVIGSHAGKTIEIIDTDAEGRLIMADALSYAVKHYQPHTLLNMATLTGSAVRTFGYVCAAVLSENEELLEAFRRAGQAAGERIWPLAPWDEFAEGLKSDVADVKNFSGNPLHGATDAFKFLQNFTHNHPRHIHFDIAGVALKQGPYAKDRQATGFGVGLLLEWLRRVG